MTIKTIKFKKINNLDPEKEREVKGLIITLALFASGMIIGAGLLKSETYNSSDFSSIFNNYILIRSEQKFYQLFLNSLSINLFSIFVANFAATSCIGVPLAVSMPVVKGLGMGVIAGYLFSEFSMNGIGYYLLTILPGGIIGNAALLLACTDACFLSADILATVLSKKQTDDSMLKNYFKKNLIIILISVLASAIDCVLVKAFAYLFIF